ncbi:MAG TPA: site-specific DNA-methyltransferase [Tissierellia bacterium]|nr:site-specific DNA-methyltransferase [Tissierellia bacterium]
MYKIKIDKLEFNNIYNVPCEEGINLLEENSVDLVVTSPPYNVDLGNNKYNKNPYDLYNDNKEHHEYISWLKEVFGNIYFKLKSGGRVCINVGDGKNGAIPTHSDIIQMMTKELNYIPMTIILWDKCQTSNRAAWGSWLSPSSPSFPRPFEYILVFAKENKKLQYKGDTDLTREEFIEYSNGLWKFAPETRQKKIGHPAMFPEELPKRLIKMFSWTDAVVLDPFAGAGTTLKVAKELGRKYIGFDISKEYCDITEKRLNEA